MKSRAKQWIELGAVYIAVLLIVISAPHLVALTGNAAVKMLIKYALYVLLVGIVAAVCIMRRKPVFSALGFQKSLIGRQILIGVLIAFVTVALFVVIPMLFGVNKRVLLSAKINNKSLFILNIIHLLFFVGMGEETIFRGYFFERIKEISKSGVWAVVISAILFGLMHFPVGLDMLQVILCTFLGLIWGFARLKIKGCSMLAVGLAHGLHDTLILILSCILF